MSWAFRVTSRTEPRGTVGAPLHDDGVTDDEPTPTTVHDRLTAAGLSEGRIAEHMTAGRVHVDGELAASLNAPAPVGSRVVIWTE